MLEVRLLGKFEVKNKKKLISIPSRPAQSLFAFLILHAGTAHHREKLAGMLWPDSLEETARDNLRHALWRVRKALPSNPKIEYLLTDDLSIAFNASTEHWLDAAELEKLSENASADELIAVLADYQGELLPGFYDEWMVLEREHLNSIFENRMTRLLSLLLDEKRWQEILHWGERWIKLGQKPEPAYRALMSAHAAKGDMSKVATTFQRCVKSLKEFGFEPSQQTRALYEKLKAGTEDFETWSTSAVKEKRKDTPKTNLPVPITSFIGRERELEDVSKLVGRNRLVTLTGPGGVGKTRLAIESSNRLLSKFKDGVWWVELAPLMDEELVPQSVAQALGLRESPGQPLTETVKSFLREKQLLLVLDNCEHLINTCARFSHDLLTQCANLRILATSREALDIMGEAEYQVQPLSLPAPDRRTLVDLLLEYEGVRLFVERANTKSSFTLTKQNATAVLQICQRLDGIPLALELAAARTKSMAVDQIPEHLNDRFGLLTQGNRTALPRHQTLRAVVDWSYDLLSAEEQALFRRLAVFAGGWTLEAVQAVCPGDSIEAKDVLDLLTNLVDKSLVIMQEQNGGTRYQMLETIGEYAREKLDESGEMEKVHQRHRDFFTAFAEQAEPKLKGAEQFEWLERLEIEHANLRAAWDCAIRNDAEFALRLASALLDFWLMSGNPGEGREWFTKLLPRTNKWGRTARRAHALGMAGRLALSQQDFASARMLLEEALPIARVSGDKREIAFVLLHLGRTGQHDSQTARAIIEECLTMYQDLRDSCGIATALLHLAWVAVDQGYYAEAEERAVKSLSTFQELGDKFRVGVLLNVLGELSRLQGYYEGAGKFYEQNIEILREQHSYLALAPPMFNLAWVSLHGKDYGKAKALFEESFNLYHRDGNKTAMMECLAGFAGVLGMTGKPEQAVRLFGAVEALFEAIGMTGRRDLSEQKEFDYYVAAVRAQLDQAAFAGAWAEGRAMTLEQAIAFALKETDQ
jgi:predicted ATPase